MELSSSTIAILVVLGVAGLLIGNFMAARPHAQESRVADFRLMARQKCIMPKLVACPTWLIDAYGVLMPTRDISHKAPTPLIAQYSFVDDAWLLPMAYYQASDGVWQLTDQGQINTPKAARQAQVLHGTPIELPDEIARRVLGLSIKANSIALYWLDDKYQHSLKAHKLDKVRADADLMALQAAFISWAEQVQNAK